MSLRVCVRVLDCEPLICRPRPPALWRPAGGLEIEDYDPIARRQICKTGDWKKVHGSSVLICRAVSPCSLNFVEAGTGPSDASPLAAPARNLAPPLSSGVPVPQWSKGAASGSARSSTVSARSSETIAAYRRGGAAPASRATGAATSTTKVGAWLSGPGAGVACLVRFDDVAGAGVLLVAPWQWRCRGSKLLFPRRHACCLSERRPCQSSPLTRTLPGDQYPPLPRCPLPVQDHVKSSMTISAAHLREAQAEVQELQDEVGCCWGRGCLIGRTQHPLLGAVPRDAQRLGRPPTGPPPRLPSPVPAGGQSPRKDADSGARARLLL